MKLYRILAVVLLIALNYSPAPAQEADSTLLTVERIFSSRDFAPERFGPARWLNDGAGYTTLEPAENPRTGMDIIRYDAATGRREVLVPAKRLIPPGDSTALTIEDYAWSTDGKLLLIFTNSKRVWRQNTRGDYWVVDLTTWQLRKLGGEAKPATLMFAKFSPDGRAVGYVRENNIYVEDLTSNKITPLTNDGSRTIINGTFDWVYEEELDLRDGFRWSPDSKSIAYWQLDASGVRDFLMINNTDSLYSFTIPVQYPKVGTTNSACRVGIVSASGGATRWLDVPGDPRNNYIARMDWAASSEEIVLQRLNRLQNTNEVMLGNARTGAVRTILTEKDSAWVDVVDDLHWLDNGKLFTWISERDGWRHIYIFSRSGEQVRLLTPGAYDVENIQRLDEKGGWLYFVASPENAAQRYLYRVRLDGKGRAERLTPVDLRGTNSYNIAPEAKWAFHTYSTIDSPPVTVLVRLPQHEVVRELAANKKLRAKIRALKQKPSEFFRVNIGGGVELDGWIIKPYNFDPNKRYPVLFYVYGEPAGQTVLDRWGGSNKLWHLMLAQQGYLVMSVDNRGTPAPRGRAWRKIVYRQVGILASQDQAAACRVIRRWPFVDSTRIAIWGWSGGGSMTLNMLFRYPELYHTGMSVAPVTDEHYYDTIYQERYMGLPKDNPEGYKNGSPITFAHQLKGNLLLVHGTGDDNVHYQNSEALINALIKENKPFTMMAYPNRSHGIFEGQNTRRHLYELLTRYLHEHLPAGPQ
ncbi:MAG: S9 family peptidase [candidate division KSB1 bacterium]|nr:S9 family peptidase [candidate division KSB1 bacterium]MDZ7301989.1 S9 family peptidase [candidate division KSB1 bacterium]MDZ7310171.1 S9 family peptidase [candidate division KSB1 bacterium]